MKPWADSGAQRLGTGQPGHLALLLETQTNERTALGLRAPSVDWHCHISRATVSTHRWALQTIKSWPRGSSSSSSHKLVLPS